MKKTILVFGSVIGAILCGNAIVMMSLMKSNPAIKGNDVIGYTAMVLLFSLIFVGVRNYRDKQLDGIITFGKAFKTGFLIALVASTIYVFAGLLYMKIFIPDFVDVYTDHVLKNASPGELQAKAAEMANFREMYKNPFFAILISYSEVLPIGAVIALISALTLKRQKNRQPKAGTIIPKRLNRADNEDNSPT